MDYMFAPGGTPYDRAVRRLFSRRANTEVVPSSLTHVGNYMNHLNTDARITRPLNKVFIGTHGNDSGWMQIRFGNFDTDGDGKLEKNTTYEVLKAANAPSFASTYHFNTASRDADTHVHIRGCMIGQAHATPFLNKLKEVLGNNVPIAAPRHFHAWWQFRNAGFAEFFCYQFQVSRPSRFTGGNARNDLIDAFKAKNFQYMGSLGAVDDDTWDSWIPRRINRNGRISSRLNFNPSILPRRGNPITRATLRIRRSYRSENDTYKYVVDGVTSNPGNAANRRQILRDTMLDDDIFKSGHEFPYYKRLEYENFNEFFEGYTWRFNYRSRSNQLLATGTRRLYTCIIPITSDPDPSDNTKNHLIFNFNPNPNNSNPAISLINEADPELFTIV